MLEKDAAVRLLAEHLTDQVPELGPVGDVYTPSVSQAFSATVLCPRSELDYTGGEPVSDLQHVQRVGWHRGRMEVRLGADSPDALRDMQAAVLAAVGVRPRVLHTTLELARIATPLPFTLQLHYVGDEWLDNPPSGWRQARVWFDAEWPAFVIGEAVADIQADPGDPEDDIRF